MQVSLVLEEGVGVSLINAVPEELIYATLRGIKVKLSHTPLIRDIRDSYITSG